MKTTIYFYNSTNNIESENFSDLHAAFYHARLMEFKRYIIVLKDHSGYSLYNSLKSTWLFPGSLNEVDYQVSSLLAS